MTQLPTTLAELQKLIEAANAKIAQIEAEDPMRKAIRAYEQATGLMEHDAEIEAGLRAAYPHLKAAMEADDGWIAVYGTPPETGEQRLRVRFRDGTTSTSAYRAIEWSWLIDARPDDIVAYKVVTP